MSFRIKGRIVSGLRVAAGFTELEWVKRQFEEKLGFTPYPGTLNLKIEEKDAAALKSFLSGATLIKIIPETDDYCMGYCFPARLEKGIKAAIVIPGVDDYPVEKLEIIAPLQIKESLKVKDGDIIYVELPEPLPILE